MKSLVSYLGNDRRSQRPERRRDAPCGRGLRARHRGRARAWRSHPDARAGGRRPLTPLRTRLRLGPVWQSRDFRLFWLGQSVSFVGSEVSALALPLTAVVVLGATPAQMGLLVAVQNAPFLLVGLLAGVWVDRFRRRPILIAADVVDAIALASIPLAVLAGWLRFEQLLLVAFVTGTSLVISSVAFQSFMPSLVRRERLVDANAALEVSASTAGIVGPGIGGVLVQLVTAPIAIAVDALSFLFSALVLLMVRTPERRPFRRSAVQASWSRSAKGCGTSAATRCCAGSWSAARRTTSSRA